MRCAWPQRRRRRCRRAPSRRRRWPGASRVSVALPPRHGPRPCPLSAAHARTSVRQAGTRSWLAAAFLLRARSGGRAAGHARRDSREHLHDGGPRRQRRLRGGDGQRHAGAPKRQHRLQAHGCVDGEVVTRCRRCALARQQAVHHCGPRVAHRFPCLLACRTAPRMTSWCGSKRRWCAPRDVCVGTVVMWMPSGDGSSACPGAPLLRRFWVACRGREEGGTRTGWGHRSLGLTRRLALLHVCAVRPQPTLTSRRPWARYAAPPIPSFRAMRTVVSLSLRVTSLLTSGSLCRAVRPLAAVPGGSGTPPWRGQLDLRHVLRPQQRHLVPHLQRYAAAQ